MSIIAFYTVQCIVLGYILVLLQYNYCSTKFRAVVLENFIFLVKNIKVFGKFLFFMLFVILNNKKKKS